MIKEYFEYVFPLLLITWVFFVIFRLSSVSSLRGQLGKALIILISFFIVLVPFHGLSLAEYILSFNPNFSIGSHIFIFILLWGQLSNKPLLRQRELLLFALWNIAVSICLFSSSLGLVSFDLYSSGYGFSLWFVITAVLTITLFLFRNSLYYIFILYILAFDLKLLYSPNFFDYITDAVLFLMSLGTLVFLLIKSIRMKKVVYGRVSNY